MTWAIASHVRLCGYCRDLIRSGDPVLLVTDRQSPRCVSCAKDRWHTEPPDTLEPQTEEHMGERKAPTPPPSEQGYKGPFQVKPAPPPAPPPKRYPALTLETPSNWARDFKVAQSGEK